MLQFNKTYFTFTILLFLLETLIALFVHDQWIRPYAGDFLVVILIYCFIKSFFNLSVWTTAIIVFCFSFFVEFTQHLNLIGKLGLENSGIAKAILGNSFSSLDLFAYVTGIFCVITIEKSTLKILINSNQYFLMEHKAKLINIISKDALIMETLAIVKELNLNDCWVGAGLIRNAVWDSLHQIKTTKRNDIDVVFFDATILSETPEKEIEAKLTQINPTAKWSVKNQARMHIRNNHQLYSNTENAISYWPETATAIAARLNSDNKIEILAPHGLDDLFNLVVCPTPNFDWTIFQQRIDEKQWDKQWKNLKFNKNH